MGGADRRHQVMGAAASIPRFVAGRVGGLLLTVGVTSFLIFSATHLAPGRPEEFLLRGRPVSPEALAAVRAQYHLDDPLLVQYWRWITGVFTGDFGRSLQFRQDVGGLLASRLPTTLLLVGYASLMIVLVGLLLGVVAALRPGKLDRSIMLISTVAAATPGFVAVIPLSAVFAVGLGWFPVFGNGEGLLDRLWHLTLPAVAVAVSVVGLLARVTRSAMLAELSREHVEVARSRGLPFGSVVRRHALRNSLGPITTLSGLIVAGLFVATFVIEVAFGLSGLGSLLVTAVQAKDFPVVQAITMIGVLAFVVTNLLVDLLYPLIDPRVSLRAGVAR
ncbi:ABC transporter permease [Micromonospora phytophila]|uniref:ABC transporter permease n=1 Tax=Micromonospora phytophila TaxID=709888 RepID=UPI002030A57B|nr:ABC transporter permease [Micromonospora phytophila]MCM0673311.1 ABC transporter permease [Micromonospora phytophila]